MREKSELLKSVFSWGIILRGDLDTIEKIKAYLTTLDIRVVYQTLDTGGLWIVKCPEGERPQ